MSNILDYLIWRRDLTLAQSEFNEIDNLILARFSYLPFDKIIFDNESITIKEANIRFENLDINDKKILQKDDINLFLALAKSNRFSNMYITKYINKINIEEEKQFSAITIIMPDDTIYISYRGTDNTLVGWKEDFNMSFKIHVPSQITAVNYLENIALTYPNKLRIGGHSKGGNLAIFASVFCSNLIKERLLNIYNNDGPGFNDIIISSNNYKEIVHKISTYLPQTSIVGRLLDNNGKYTVVKSTQKGLMQHDLYSWEISGNHFIAVEDFDNESKFIDTTIKGWLNSITPQQREEFINIIFEILSTTDVKTLSELKKQWFKNSKILFTNYKNMDTSSKMLVSSTIDSLFLIARKNLSKNFPKFSEKKNKEIS